MNKSKAYRATPVKKIEIQRVVAGRPGQHVVVGLDVGKQSVLVVLRWNQNDFERPWQVQQPSEIPDLVERLAVVGQGREMLVALEPTGTYGDPLRQALADAGVTVHRVSPKASHDYAEVFDGVPSQHDGKDAAVVAELAALGKSSPWPFVVQRFDQELACCVDWLEAQRRSLTMWSGRLESLLARHWPEATTILRLTSGVLLRGLEAYGGPAALAADAASNQRLLNWGRGLVSPQTVQALLAAAGGSLGVRQSEIDLRRVRQVAGAILACRKELRLSTGQLRRLAADHPVIQSQAAAVGVGTACVLWVHLGDPRDYDSGGAYRKAMGLNLTERSSGQWRGQVKISKRGHSQVRRWLYLAALRLLKQPSVRSWYEAKTARRAGDRRESMRAIVALMRKLSLALYRVGTGGQAFEASKLFASPRESSSPPVSGAAS